MTDTNRELLRVMTFGAYDLQMLRMQTGLRLCASFRSKLKDEQKVGQNTPEDSETNPDNKELSEEAEKMIDKLRDSYKRLTDGIARNRTLPSEKGFTGDALISEFTELVLVHQYISLEKNERSQFAQLETALSKIPVYNDYLIKVRGIGPAMAAVLLSYFDPHKASHVSDFWAYAGLDVAPDGRGRSRRAEHLIDRPYITKDGKEATKKSVTYNPWLKSRLLGAMATAFMRTSGCRWRKSYDDYKHRLESDPNRRKVTSTEYKKMFIEDKDSARNVWTPGRIHRAALRYMVKMFLIEFYTKWREAEGLDPGKTYHEAKLGHVHGAPTFTYAADGRTSPREPT